MLDGTLSRSISPEAAGPLDCAAPEWPGPGRGAQVRCARSSGSPSSGRSSRSPVDRAGVAGSARVARGAGARGRRRDVALRAARPRQRRRRDHVDVRKRCLGLRRRPAPTARRQPIPAHMLPRRDTRRSPQFRYCTIRPPRIVAHEHPRDPHPSPIMLDNSPVVAGIICQIGRGKYWQGRYLEIYIAQFQIIATEISLAPLLQRRHDYVSRDASGLQAGPVDMQLPPYFARETRGSRVGGGAVPGRSGAWRGRLATSKPNRDACGQAKCEFGDWRRT